MKNSAIIQQKIYKLPELLLLTGGWKYFKKKVVFTNGCFDVLHEGHISSLSKAAEAGDMLIVGVNSDASTARLKGKGRPVNNENARALVLASLVMVDAVVIFEEDTPLELIKALMPDVLVKGGDYTVDKIAGAKEVIENGGEVIINPSVEGSSTTEILKKINNL